MLHSIGYTDDGKIWLMVKVEVQGTQAMLKLEIPVEEVPDFIKKVEDAAEKARSKIIIPNVRLVQ